MEEEHLNWQEELEQKIEEARVEYLKNPPPPPKNFEQLLQTKHLITTKRGAAFDPDPSNPYHHFTEQCNRAGSPIK